MTHGDNLPLNAKTTSSPSRTFKASMRYLEFKVIVPSLDMPAEASEVF